MQSFPWRRDNYCQNCASMASKTAMLTQFGQHSKLNSANRLSDGLKTAGAKPAHRRIT
jgi:hypothetical protein